jgi:hypothetical protein
MDTDNKKINNEAQNPKTFQKLVFLLDLEVFLEEKEQKTQEELDTVNLRELNQNLIRNFKYKKSN